MYYLVIPWISTSGAMNFDLQDPAEMADAAADEGAAPDSPAAPEMSSIEAQIR